jgi:acetate---CoA ligase (ADP-forming) subunit beta
LMNLLKEAMAKGRATLSEYDSKRFLSSFGIPICREVLAENPDSAATVAKKIGYPVVLKASGADLAHKTEIGGIALNLKNIHDVRKEGLRLMKIRGCEALLVQEMVKGTRELVCGLTRDLQLGPCVMFGLGGVFTEVLDDVSFRIAPLTLGDAQEMISEIRAKRILDPFRGEAAIDQGILSHVLVSLGKIGLEYENVAAIDINPLKVRPDGKPVAVDALVVLRKE